MDAITCDDCGKTIAGNVLSRDLTLLEGSRCLACNRPTYNGDQALA